MWSRLAPSASPAKSLICPPQILFLQFNYSLPRPLWLQTGRMISHYVEAYRASLQYLAVDRAYMERKNEQPDHKLDPCNPN